MTSDEFNFQSALNDFRSARQQAALQEIVGRLTGKSTRLLSYEEVAKKLKLSGRTDRGIQQIPVKAIVGSVGRYTDFTRTFLPRQAEDEQRWARVKTVVEGDGGMPPIDVYQVGEVYFVLDGNHRVSIARQNGMEKIDACVIEVQTRVPLTPDVQPDDLIVKAEYAEFLEQTRLADLRPNVDLSLTAPGRYEDLKQQIEVQRYLMALEKGGEISYEDAALAWYDEAYLPMAEAIRERGLLRWFPNRTEADLYLWVSEHRAALEQELGWAVRPEAAVTDLAVRESGRAEDKEAEPGSWRRAKMLDRYAEEQLFKDILVPFSGRPESWIAVRQALVVARRDQSQLHGMHIAIPGREADVPDIATIQMQFEEMCDAAGVKHSFMVESGDIPQKICERALLADLVVLNTAHPPAEGLPSLASGLRTIIWRCARPILTACCDPSPLDRALLAFDGSPKSKEALFVATYLAEQWKASLTVAAVTDGTRVTPSVLDYPRSYLELHEIEAEYVVASGKIDVLHQLMDERGINILLMGGYSVPAVQEVMVGSAVNFMLREDHRPIFICR